jgi:peptidoglycan/xylan/chitin deacetylase (PgdA/CDA1 family)
MFYQKTPILITIDFDGEVGLAAMPGRDKPLWISHGEFEARVGVERLLRLFDREKIKATFCIVGQIAQRYPKIVQTIANKCHEIGAHGWTHRAYVELNPEEEEQEIVKTKTVLEKTVGKLVVGHRTPLWNPSPNTIPLLIKHRFLWNSDFLNDELPYFHKINGKPTKLVEIPPNFSLNDWAQLTQFRQDPYAMFQTWRDEFDVLYKEKKIYCLTLHPLEIGRGARVAWLERLINYIKKHKNIKFMTCQELARSLNL